MTNATFRFYARLNAFLAVERRGQAFRCSCAESATTKHMLEALGVPHTEAALVLVNGAPAGLDWPIEAGDRIAVYPKFEQLDVGSLTAIEPVPPGPPRFVAEAHLGGLARLLRMAGFDTLYDNNDFEDAAMAELANRERRALLTSAGTATALDCCLSRRTSRRRVFSEANQRTGEMAPPSAYTGKRPHGRKAEVASRLSPPKGSAAGRQNGNNQRVRA